MLTKKRSGVNFIQYNVSNIIDFENDHSSSFFDSDRIPDRLIRFAEYWIIKSTVFNNRSHSSLGIFEIGT